MSPLISTYFLQRQSDDRLVAAARAGNERAFEVLVRRHHKALLAYARRLTGTDARAEDALQQALLQAWVALRGDAHPEQFKPWLFRIVHNVAVSGLRRSQHAIVGLDEALETAERVDSVDARIAFREALTGLAALPEPQRRAMVLTALGGSSHDEAAAELGLSGGAVRGLIYRARATLRSAAALLPAPLAAWMLNRPRRASVGERTAELLAGSSSVGAGGLIVKAGAIAATAGAFAVGSQVISGPASQRDHHAGARRAPRLAGLERAGSNTAPAGAVPGRTILVVSTDADRRSTAVSVGSVAAGAGHQSGSGAAGAWSHVQSAHGRARSGGSPRSGPRGSGGGRSDGGHGQSSGGGDSGRLTSGGSPGGGGGMDSGTGTTTGGHDHSGSGAGSGSPVATSSGTSSSDGSGSTTVSSDGGGGSGGSDGGSSSPAISPSAGGVAATTTTTSGD